jgi:molybdopterin/thiamine biosynthesis adenylyltransferase
MAAPRGPNFTPSERDRYARHILLKEIGGQGQQRLKAARVAVIGLGGLGSPVGLYLAAAGVGQLVLIDPDTVGLSNLQRQVLFRMAELGQPKVQAAEAALAGLNPEVRVTAHPVALTAENAASLLADADVVVDGCDDFATRFAVNRACVALAKPLVSGAVGAWDGQVGVFRAGLTRTLSAGQRAPCYQCLVPEMPANATYCAEMGIVGALTGVVGSVMALETIKLIARAGSALDGRLWLFDGLKSTSRTVAVRPDPACPVCGGGPAQA